MKLIFTPFKIVQFKFFLLFCTLFLMQITYSQSTIVSANFVSDQSNVDGAANAVDASLTTKAQIRASSGIIIGVGAYSGSLELQFPTLLPANTTSFVKIDTDENLLPSLLGGTLGGLLSNVAGAVLIGNQEFTVQAKNNTNVVLEGNSQIANDFSTNSLKIIVNANNDYFIAITPSLAYNRIKLTNRLGSLVGLGNTKRLGVYGAFYISSPDLCGGASYTSFDGSGLNLDLLNLGGAGVTNPHFVLDSNPNNFSRLSLGIISVAGRIQQTLYFDGASQTSDEFTIRLKVDASLLALGVANNIDIIPSSGSTILPSVTLNSLLNLDLLTLLQGNQVVSIPFSPNANVDKITIRYRSLLNVQLTQSLDLYSITRAPARPTITDPFTLNASICSGNTASLIAQTTAGTVLNWYSQPQGGSLLATTNSAQAFITTPLLQSTSFYVSAQRLNCPEQSTRIKVDVKVTTTPTASDVVIANSIDACNGFVVLSPISTIGGATFRYYKDQLKTQEITTGFSGDVGVTYVKNATTGQLTISGLTALNSPYNYYISITVNSLCENPINTLKQVTVNFSSGLNLLVQPTIQGCGSVNLTNAIVDFDSSSNIQYNFFDALNNPITATNASNITISGTYFIQSTSILGGCSSVLQQVIVTINPTPTLVVSNQNIVVNTGNSVTLQATSNTSVIWYDSTGTALASNVTPTFTVAGFYTFTAIAGSGNCTISASVFVTVLDVTQCPVLTERKYGDSQSWSSILTGGVVNASNAIDENPKTYSTITTGLGLLGIGTTWQSIQWDATIAAGTPVSVKLGSQYSGLSLIGIYSIVGTKRNSSGVPIDIGFIQPISVSILDLLPGENSFEYTFVPSNLTGPKEYDGIRIIVGSIASVSQNLKIYDAYYNNQVTQITCTTDDVKDVFSGARDLGIGVATSLVGVDNPFDAVDNNPATFATMYSGLGILAAANLTVVFKTPTLSGDSLQMILSSPSTLLNLNLLTGFSIQRYLGNTPVGPAIDNSSTLLSLTLLNGGAEVLVTIQPQTQSFDKIRISFGGVAGVLDILRVHQIKRSTNLHVLDADITNTIEVCATKTIQLEVTPQPCQTYIWYDAPIGGNIVSTGTTFTIPSSLPAGTYDFYIQLVRFGCEAFDRGKVTVIVGQTAPPNAITQVLVNGSPATTFCSVTGNVTFTATLNSTLTITNPIFYWYSVNGTTATLISGQTTSTLNITGLLPGTYTYQVGVSSDEYCETAEADRVTITITILPFSVASDITVSDVTICQGQNAVITPTSVNVNPQFTWYFSNNTTQPITNGLIVGTITYTIATNGTLTVSGLTSANSPAIYYVGLTSDVSCLNQSGNFKPVSVTINGGTTPTTNNATQSFCLVNNPTVANLQANQTGVSWYLTASGGTALNPTTPLINGTIYYGSIVDGSGCASSTRLQVSVIINNGTTPTTNNATQSFCLVNNPTVANLQANQTGVSWFLNSSGGTALNPTTPLINGTIYYGSIVDGSGCTSSTRLEVSVVINNGTTPTTNNATQSFCLVNNPTVANLQANQTGVSWFLTPSGGTALNPTTPLINGTIYYGSIIDGSGCASSTRLQVSVIINNGTTPTTNNGTQSFCLVNNPTVANLQANQTGVSWFLTSSGGTALNPTIPLINGTIYYGSIVDGSGCASSTRLEVSVIINNGTTPTTNNATQSFCLVNNPTVANLQANQTGVSWFLTSSGGTALNPTTPLINGTIYYGSIVDGSGCASSTRLQVTVVISNGTTPTTNNVVQNFCLVNNPRVSDLQSNQTNVSWFLTPNGGTALTPTTPLINGTTYYGSIIDSFGCESSTRLQVSVIINNGTTPTTSNATQTFCLVNNPTVANLQANQSNVSWFLTPNGGTALNPQTPLITGTTYYGSIVDGSGCASSVRLQVDVILNNGTTPTTNNATQSFCLVNNPTVANLQSNQTNVSWFLTASGGTALNPTTPLTNGTIYYGSIIDGSGCASSVRLQVTVTISNDVASISGGSLQECTFSQVTYTTNAGMSNYIWTVSNGTIISGGQTTDNFVTVSFTTIGAASVAVDYLSTCGSRAMASYNFNVVVCSDLTILKSVDNPTPSIDDTVTFTILVSNVGTSDISNIVVTELLPSGYTYVSSNPSVGTYNNVSGIWTIPILVGGQSATLTVTATVLSTGSYLNTATIITSSPIDSDTTNNTSSIDTEPICLIVYNEFSPNNDGANDVFIIDCIENYPNNNFEVYNRYGILVYSKNHYMNDWDGTSNVSGTIKSSDKLPSGTYYYILNLNQDSIVKKGWLSITK